MKPTLLFICSLLFVIQLKAQSKTGTLQGKVTDEQTGQPLSGVNIILMQNGNWLGVQSTNANGLYYYDQLGPKILDVIFAVKGKKIENREIKNVEIRAGNNTTLNVKIGATMLVAEEITILPDLLTNPDAFAIIQKMPIELDEPKEEFKGQYYPFIPEQDFVFTAIKPQSTFSADVDHAFYSIIKRMISHNYDPPTGAVRIEEMLNYFEYNYPNPTNSDAFAVYTETAQCAWNKDHLLVHIGLQGREYINEDLPPAHLVFLIDVSGSMASSDKLPLVKSSMRTLVKQLRTKDRVSIVTYSDYATVILENCGGDQKEIIMRTLGKLQAEGSTAGAQGLQKAYEVAKKYFIKSGNNRVIIATDGDFNVGISTDKELLKFIAEKRKTGVYLTVLGFGMDNLQDGKLELLADHGNGNYGYISTVEDAEKILVNEMGATLLAIAKDVKIQAVFNPQLVKSYRLIGYENRVLTDQQFDKNKTDAGDIGAGHSVTALYEIIPEIASTTLTNTNFNANQILSLTIQYKDPKSATQFVNKDITTAVILSSTPFEQASENFRFASAVAEFGLILRNSQLKSNASIVHVIKTANASKTNDKFGYKEDFIGMVKQYAQYQKIAY